MNKNTLLLIVKYAIGMGLLAWLIWRYWHYDADGQDVGLGAALGKPVHLVPFLLAGGLFTLGAFLTYVRWWILVRAQDLPFTLGDACRLGLVGSFFNSFLPGAIGGDLIKATFIAREQSRRSVAVATVVIDRLIGFAGLFWLATFLGCIFWFSGALTDLETTDQAREVLGAILLIAAGLSLGSLIIWFLLGFVSPANANRFALTLEKITRGEHALAEVWRAVALYRQKSHTVALAMVLSVIGHIGFVLTFYFSAQSLTAPDLIPSLGVHYLVVPVGMTIGAGVPTPAGIGGAELAFGTLYQWVGFPFAFGVLGSLVQRAWMAAIGFAGYLVFLRLRPSLGKT